MNKRILFSFLGVLVVLLSMAGYKQVIVAKEKELDMQYLNHIPTVLYDDLQLELYEYWPCKKKSEKDSENARPGSCEELTMEDALAGQEAVTFDKGAELKVISIQQSGELEDSDGPASGVRRNSSGGYTKDGVSLGPGDIEITNELIGDEIITTVKLPDEPGYYTGRIDFSTPSGGKFYVFHFNLK